MNTFDKPVLFTEAQKLRPRPSQLQDHIRRACEDEKFWAAVWPYLTGSVNTDSSVMDHGIIVDKLLAWDRANGERLTAMRLSYRKLWAAFSRQVGKYFDVEHGHLVGLLPTTEGGPPNQNYGTAEAA